MASDNWQEAAVLPPYRRLVLDEAHHLEDVAAMHLGAQVSRLGVDRLLSRLEKNGRGLLPTLRSLLFGRDDLLSTASRDLVQQGLSDALGAARPCCTRSRSEEHTSELQSPCNLVCRLLLEKKK